jgi:hypothetical protein
MVDHSDYDISTMISNIHAELGIIKVCQELDGCDKNECMRSWSGDLIVEQKIRN